MKFAVCIVSFLIFAIDVQNGESARILGLFPTWSRSHLIIQMSTIQTLVDRGHDVTVATTLPLSEKKPKYRHLKLTEQEVPREFLNRMINNQVSVWQFMKSMGEFLELGMGLANDSLNDPELKKVMREETFDLVVMGYFLNDFQMGVAAHFKCPLVIIDTHNQMQESNGWIGNPSEPLYVPAGLSTLDPFNFLSRLKNVAAHIVEHIMFKFFYKPAIYDYYKKNFPSDKYPAFDDVKKNVSLVLHTSHFSEGLIRPNVPAFVQIGGIQVKPKPDPLPQDIKEMLDGAKEHGAIYFCLGSNARSSELKTDTMATVYKVLAGLKQKVIWKWEDENLPGNSPNILFKKWLPQDDILAHPNVKLFISHGGLGGVSESKYHGVPLVGIPLYGDQFQVLETVVEAGFGLSLDYHNLTEESMRSAVLDVLENPKYTNAIQQFSKLYRDRPMSTRETAAYWMEYVIRHKGAKHMQSPAVHMTITQYFGLDMIRLVIVSLLILYFGIRYLIKKLFSKLCKAKSKKNKTE